jgi:hypothetical protein
VGDGESRKVPQKRVCVFISQAVPIRDKKLAEGRSFSAIAGCLQHKSTEIDLKFLCQFVYNSEMENVIFL